MVMYRYVPYIELITRAGCGLCDGFSEINSFFSPQFYFITDFSYCQSSDRN